MTFLFTDVEGSTRLLHNLGAEGYAEALAEHRRVLREAFVAHGGVEVDTQGDAFFVAFPTAPGALEAATTALEGLASGPIKVRMGIHTGTPHLADEGYVGVDVHRAARIAAAGHGGQVLVSASAAALLGVDELRELGEHRLKDLSAPERIYQLGDGEFPPGNAWGVAASLYYLGAAEADDQDYERAREIWEESAGLFHEAGDSFHTLLATRMLAWACDELGETERARGLKDTVLEQARAAGHKHLQIHVLEALAHTAAPDGRVEEAASLLEQAWELNRELGDRFREAVLVCRFARVLAFGGRAEAAAQVLASGETLYEEMGATPMGWLRRGNDEALTLIRAQLDEAAFGGAWDRGRTLTADEAVALGLGELHQEA